MTEAAKEKLEEQLRNFEADIPNMRAHLTMQGLGVAVSCALLKKDQPERAEKLRKAFFDALDNAKRMATPLEDKQEDTTTN